MPREQVHLKHPQVPEDRQVNNPERSKQQRNTQNVHDLQCRIGVGVELKPDDGCPGVQRVERARCDGKRGVHARMRVSVAVAT